MRTFPPVAAVALVVGGVRPEDRMATPLVRSFENVLGPNRGFGRPQFHR